MVIILLYFFIVLDRKKIGKVVLIFWCLKEKWMYVIFDLGEDVLLIFFENGFLWNKLFYLLCKVGVVFI